MPSTSPLTALILFTALSATLVGCSDTADTSAETLAAQWNTEIKQWTESELQQLNSGQKLYKATCAGCHLASGEGQLSIGAPALQGNQLLTQNLQQAIAIIRHGRGSMPAFGNSLSDAKLAAIISYISNAWGNNRGEIVPLQQLQGQQ